jgi:pimeloyl-ACP methyl ester carboxylesterase
MSTPADTPGDGVFPDGFDDLTLSRVPVGEVSLRVRHGGSGPPLLLLHGYPETHLAWGLVAGALARDFTVVAPDLRGYGDSSKPAAVPGHETYGKRAMAEDCTALMAGLGFDAFDVVGHDRGGRVAYRMALDHPEVVRRLTVLDVIPTGEVWARADARFALGYWHWAFLAQPHPVPERLIGRDPDFFFLDAEFGGVIRRFPPVAVARLRPLRPGPGGHRGHVRGLPGRGHLRPSGGRRGPGRRAADRLPHAGALGGQGCARGLVRHPRHLAGVGRRRHRAGVGLRSLHGRGEAARDARRDPGLPRRLPERDRAERIRLTPVGHRVT